MTVQNIIYEMKEKKNTTRGTDEKKKNPDSMCKANALN